MTTTVAGVQPIATQPAKAPQPPSRWALLWAMIGRHRAPVIGSILVGIAMLSCSIAAGALSAYTVGLALTGASVDELWPLVIWLMVLVVPLVTLPWAETVLAHIAAFRILADLRVQIYNAFERLSPGYLLERRSGDLAATAMTDVEHLEIGLSHTLPPLVVACVVPLAVLAALATLHWLLALVLLPFVIAVATVPFWARRHADQVAGTLRERIGATGAEVVDGVQGLREIVSFGAQPSQRQLLQQREEALQEAQVAHARQKGYELGVSDILSGLGMLTIVVLAAWLTAQGQLPRTLFPVSIILAGGAFAPLAFFMSGGREFPTVFAAGERVYTLLTAEPPVVDLVEQAPPGPITPRVQFTNVCFRYAANLPDVLHGVSLMVEPGETVALVGHSGAGKSTCANLLLRLWDVKSGSITIGGNDLRHFPQATLRDLISYVPQDVYLFNRSVRENIRLGQADATEAQVEAAARLALALEFIEDLPDGWETQLGERGARLSGGQRQRIAIARALLRDTPILLLDEAVSSLDVASEQLVQQAIHQVRQGRTTLIIAHRLSTIRTADRIVVLDWGRVVESGRYDELVAAGGTFARLTTTATAIVDDRMIV